MTKDDPVSRLEVRGRLGRGGTAEVFRVFDPVLNREAALKVSLPDNRADFEKLVHRERQLIGGYRFPGLVRLLPHHAESPDQLLLELCEGPTLERVGRVDDLDLAINLLSALALDLEFLHAIGEVGAPNKCPDGSAADDVRLQPCGFEAVQNADMGPPAAHSAAEGDTDQRSHGWHIDDPCMAKKRLAVEQRTGFTKIENVSGRKCIHEAARGAPLPSAPRIPT